MKKAVRRITLGSTCAIAIASGGAAEAGCTPSPTQAQTVTTCTGTDDGGLVMATAGTTVEVAAGAQLRSPGTDTPALNVLNSATGTINVAGTIDGREGDGIEVAAAPSTFRGFSYYSNILISVAAGGVITGISGIHLPSADSADQSSVLYQMASVDNSGRIEGTGGAALSVDPLLSTAPSDGEISGFDSITNRSGGTIGGISGAFSTLANDGIIDGGTLSAISAPSILNNIESQVFGFHIANTGTITNTAAVSTISIGTGPSTYATGVTLTNSGTIQNTGTGAALDGRFIDISNAAGGLISTAGSTAITGGLVRLVNRGTVVGNVITSGAGSRIDSVGGVITGDVFLGGGGATVMATYGSGGSLDTGIRGGLSASGANNVIEAVFANDATLSGGFTIPSGFQTIEISPSDGTTTTLVDGFSPPASLAFGGRGTIVNQTAIAVSSITGASQVFQNEGRLDSQSIVLSAGTFTNSGIIRSTTVPADQSTAIVATNSFVNSGTIDIAGLGVDAGGSSSNSGTIAATDLALRLEGGTMLNNGTIRSSGGTAVMLTGTLINSGRIDGAQTGVMISQGGDQLINQAGGVVTGGTNAITVANGEIDNAGLIEGNVSFGAAGGTYSTESGGRLTGNLDLGSNSTFITDLVGRVTGGVVGVDGTATGEGHNTIEYRVGADASAGLQPVGIFDRIGFQLSNGASLTATGDDLTLPLIFAGDGSVDLNANITLHNAPVVFSSVDLVNRGRLTEFLDAGSDARPIALQGGEEIDEHGQLLHNANIDNRGEIIVSDAAPTGAIRAVAASAAGTFSNEGTITLTDAVGVYATPNVVNTGSIVGSSDDTSSRGVVASSTLVNSGTIATSGDAVLAIDYANGPLSVTNSGTISSRQGIAIAAPIHATTITNTASGIVSGGVDQPAIFFASGSVIDNQGTINGDVSAAYDSVGFYYAQGNYYRQSLFPDPPRGTVVVTSGDPNADTVIRNTGVINGAVSVLGGNDRVENGGTITGSVALGAGDDTFVAGPGSSVGGGVDGGAGTDTIELHSAGTDAAPTLFDAAGYSNFERLSQKEGVTAFGGALHFDDIAIDGGRLIGLAGSTLTAPGGVAVASGATFGSAGTVIGDVTVAGTLSPGASPGTMTVQGNVALQGGSHSLFELTTGASDQLHATGAITIADGATLDLTGARPLTPGAALDLLVADGGISGSFTTINRPATIFGFLRQTAGSIELFGQFANAGFTPQVSTTIAYVNGLLTSGAASPALIAAAPSLLTTNGATNGSAFSRLNPEAYASSMQIGIENGLSLAKAARSGVAVNPGTEPSLFGFAQGLGGWRTFDGAALGTSQTKLQSHGELGGVGYGSTRASLAAFVGYIKADERIAALGAHTDASDTVAGVIGHLGLGGFDMSALLAYDGGTADLRRAAIGGATIGSRFRLRSWIGDLQIGYAFRLGANWALKPQGGFTYVGEHRGAATESGSTAFDLAVAADHQHAAFVDGTLALEGGLDADARVHPWLSGGMRRQLSGARTIASASFAGASTDFAVAGVGRSRTLATAVAGLSVDLSRAVSLFASYNGEFGKNGDGEGVNGGLKMRF